MPALIICSTPRLVRNLALVHQRNQLAQGQQRWQALSAFTLSDWLSTLINDAIICGEISPEAVPMAELSTSQEAILWEQAIAASLKQNDAEALFDKSGLASAAQEANRLIIEWNLTLSAEEMTEETRHFLQWRQRFQALCKHAGVLEAVRYMTWQIECIESGAGQMPARVSFAGFDRQNPLFARLMKALAQRGVEVSLHVLGYAEPQSASVFALEDQEAECRVAVAWAKNYLAENATSRIAIVVPELSALRNKLASLLDQALHPHAVTPAYAEQARCYDFSLGTPLTKQAIVTVALALLRLGLTKNSISQKNFSSLLLSPYWSASTTEADARAKLDALMRQNLGLNVSPVSLMRFVQKSGEAELGLSINQLNADLKSLLDGCNQLPARQLPSAWAHAFKQILEACHWQGERSLSSYEYQATRAFEKVLDQFKALDSLQGKISAHEALSRLVQLSKEQVFQVESKSLPQLQVMGMLEAAAEPLQAIWVMGMNDHIWPPIARPNALIPASLQRLAGCPNSCSEVQTEFAQSIHQRLLRSAKQVIFSYAERDGDRELRMSPVIQGLEVLDLQPNLSSTIAEVLAEQAGDDLEWTDDSIAPKVQEGEHVAGGTGLLKAQAICPAWAFYQYRLNARALWKPVNGLDLMERGNLVHEVLAKFWQGKSHADLQAMSAAEMQMAVNAAATEVLVAFNQAHEHVFSPVFIDLEHERLSKLVCGWLNEIELKRPVGFSVKACELEDNVEIEGIRIKLIVDRVDALEDGRLIVIDYKTGRALDYKNWAEERITEPQLPIYAAFLLNQEEVAAVCFAKVRTAEHSFAGIAADEGLLQSVAGLDEKSIRKTFEAKRFPNWESLLEHWKKAITNIVLELKSGEAAVKVANEKDLAYCEVLPLLRLPERQLQYERSQMAPAQAIRVEA